MHLKTLFSSISSYLNMSLCDFFSDHSNVYNSVTILRDMSYPYGQILVEIRTLIPNMRLGLSRGEGLDRGESYLDMTEKS